MHLARVWSSIFPISFTLDDLRSSVKLHSYRINITYCDYQSTKIHLVSPSGVERKRDLLTLTIYIYTFLPTKECLSDNGRQVAGTYVEQVDLFLFASILAVDFIEKGRPTISENKFFSLPVVHVSMKVDFESYEVQVSCYL